MNIMNQDIIDLTNHILIRHYIDYHFKKNDSKLSDYFILQIYSNGQNIENFKYILTKITHSDIIPLVKTNSRTIIKMNTDLLGIRISEYKYVRGLMTVKDN